MSENSIIMGNWFHLFLHRFDGKQANGKVILSTTVEASYVLQLQDIFFSCWARRPSRHISGDSIDDPNFFSGEDDGISPMPLIDDNFKQHLLVRCWLKMANYQLELWQNNGVLNRNNYWHSDSFSFLIELHVHRHNNGVLRVTNRRFYMENRFFLSERGMREFFIRILLEEQIIPENSNGIQFIHHSPSGIPIPIPVYSLAHLVHFVLHIGRLMRNDPRNEFLTLLPIHLYIAIDEFRQLQFLNDSIILDGESLDRGLQQLDDSIILDGELFEEVGLSEYIDSTTQRRENRDFN
ncbi:hypothetical protein JRO89_XS02G0128800 [Xanthoceras sorbifolium]|uniref:Uncharacterized protein n=1 Tax=Xanthoceras sorbifolium TaxID=99658 RepID=A0ABQ8IG61_9ROSI|nr:hypothetical protein JRO89_XS02G0128800 [Xanthoceras sorbifolium]